MKLCPQCERENPSSANHCMHCKTSFLPEEKTVEKIDEVDQVTKLHRELKETKKANDLLVAALEAQLKKRAEESERNNTPPSSQPLPPPPPPVNRKAPIPSGNNNKNKIIVLVSVLATLAILVFGVSYYSNTYLPGKRDSDADKYYTFAETTNLRHSKEAGVEYNKIITIDYGSQLITYLHNDDGWSQVKDASGNEGYVSSDLLLNKSDFFILNSIFGDKEAKACVNTTKYRLALLDYYKANALNDNWKIYCLPKDTKPNTVFYPRLYNKNSKYTDFAVLIKNIRTGERKLVTFGFNDDETLAWTKDAKAPDDGYIRNMYVDYKGKLRVDYSK